MGVIVAIVVISASTFMAGVGFANQKWHQRVLDAFNEHTDSQRAQEGTPLRSVDVAEIFRRHLRRP